MPVIQSWYMLPGWKYLVVQFDYFVDGGRFEVRPNSAFSKVHPQGAILQEQVQSEMQNIVAREAFRSDAGRFVLY